MIQIFVDHANMQNFILASCVPYKKFRFPGEYKLPEGVYLLLGFSAVDEALLRPHTGLGAEDAVRLLQQYLHSVSREGVRDIFWFFL